MILIADSGSTKTDWRLIDAGGRIFQYKTQGLNPYFFPGTAFEHTLRTELLPQLEPDMTTLNPDIFFYGAGCGNPQNVQLVTDAFLRVFTGAKVAVAGDLLGTARGLCGTEPGLVAILGTGMNTGTYDGRQIVSNRQSLGYILGDEGSGAYLGKQLLHDYLTSGMPVSLKERLENRFKLSPEAVLLQVYKEPFPNRYLASFSKFIYQNLSEDYCLNLVSASFRLFFDETICKYPDFRNLRLQCSGSVAFWYSNILRRIAEEKGVVLDKVVESPIAGLTLFHEGNGEI